MCADCTHLNAVSRLRHASGVGTAVHGSGRGGPRFQPSAPGKGVHAQARELGPVRMPRAAAHGCHQTMGRVDAHSCHQSLGGLMRTVATKPWEG